MMFLYVINKIPEILKAESKLPAFIWEIKAYIYKLINLFNSLKMAWTFLITSEDYENARVDYLETLRHILYQVYHRSIIERDKYFINIVIIIFWSSLESLEHS